MERKREYTVNFLKYVSCRGLDASGSTQEPVMGSCKHGNEPSGSIKHGEFLA
jgi:hypothetical protein